MNRVSQQACDPNKLYKIRLRFKNAASAPSSATTVTIGRVLVMDVQEIAIEVASGRGDASSGKGVPVNATGTFPVRDVNNVFTEIASAALTSSATTGATSAPENGGGGSASFIVPVTAVSGTNPTLDIGIEESDDSGTNWVRIWDLPRITATGVYRTPVLMLSGNRLRYVQTVGGTTPSFTRSVLRMAQQNVLAPIRRAFFDRALNVNTLNATTPTYSVEGCSKFYASITLSSIGTGAPSFQFQFSDDNANWYSAGAVVAGIVGTVRVASNSGELPKFVRLVTQTAGVGAVLTHVCIKGME
ncbi:hypothetical protein LJR235_001646 [Pararhizobium sp. LjRoot235]|uniref:hypothetical protein n=1 Tax=Pararhizobium sp. LjRoot235 TaxID=3342291 RepID=UPI003ECD46D8